MRGDSLAASSIAVAPPVTTGSTRDCTDPWTFVITFGDGSVRPCCSSLVTLGRLDRSMSLEALEQNEAAIRLRKQLLSGELDSFCETRARRAAVPIVVSRRKIAALLRTVRMDEHEEARVQIGVALADAKTGERFR